MRKQQEMSIIRNKEIARNVFELVLTGDLVSLMLQAGQFVNIKVGDGGLILRRPISICSVDYGKKEVTLIYRAGGAGTASLSEKKVGESVNVLGPLGTGFDIGSISANQTVALVGGGVGVPPLYEAAKRLSAKGNKVVIVLGFESKEDVFYEEKFQELGDVHVATMNGSYGYGGHVVGLMKEKNIDFDWVLACGPKPMLQGLHAEYGESKEGLLSFEERMACGIGACYACVCTMADGSKPRVCKEGPVFKMSEVTF